MLYTYKGKRIKLGRMLVPYKSKVQKIIEGKDNHRASQILKSSSVASQKSDEIAAAFKTSSVTRAYKKDFRFCIYNIREKLTDHRTIVSSYPTTFSLTLKASHPSELVWCLVFYIQKYLTPFLLLTSLDTQELSLYSVASGSRTTSKLALLQNGHRSSCL